MPVAYERMARPAGKRPNHNKGPFCSSSGYNGTTGIPPPHFNNPPSPSPPLKSAYLHIRTSQQHPPHLKSLNPPIRTIASANLQIFKSAHRNRIRTSADLHIRISHTSQPHSHIFKSSNPQICTSAHCNRIRPSSNPPIRTSSHPHILTSANPHIATTFPFPQSFPLPKLNLSPFTFPLSPPIATPL
jgi:hypothetical protein